MSEGLRELQEGLRNWVIMAHPDQISDYRAVDVHFVKILASELPTREDFIKIVQAACGQGEFQELTAEDLSGGPSYITLGAWLGSQDLALMFIGVTELVLEAEAITPERIGFTGHDADMMAGNGLVMLGPTKEWM